jgi:hypothetical protein
MKTFDSQKKFFNHAGFGFEDGKRFEQRRFTLRRRVKSTRCLQKQAYAEPSVV